MAETLLDVQDLCISLKDGTPLVKGACLAVKAGSVCALVGDSGSGKSLIAAAISGVQAENLRCEGAILYKGENLLALGEKQLGRIRGAEIGIVMQNCAGSLNPLVRNGRQLAMVVKAHSPRGTDVRERCLALLGQVGLDEPQRVMRGYPHQLSGGMKQRLLLAMGLAGGPSLLILDEPTKGLDVVLRGVVQQLIVDIRQNTGVAILLITHDMALAAALSNECAVLQNGVLTTRGKTNLLFIEQKDDALARLIAAEQRINRFVET